MVSDTIRLKPPALTNPITFNEPLVLEHQYRGTGNNYSGQWEWINYKGIIDTVKTNLETSISVIETDINTIETDITNLDGRVTTLETNVTNLDSRVTTTETNITNINTEINNIETDITSLETSVTTLETNVTNLDGRVTTIEADVTNIDGRVTTLETNVTNIQSDITNIEGDITTLETTVTNIETNVTNLGNTVTTLSTDVSNLTTLVDGISDDFDNKIDKLPTTAAGSEVVVAADGGLTPKDPTSASFGVYSKTYYDTFPYAYIAMDNTNVLLTTPVAPAVERIAYNYIPGVTPPTQMVDYTGRGIIEVPITDTWADALPTPGIIPKGYVIPLCKFIVEIQMRLLNGNIKDLWQDDLWCLNITTSGAPPTTILTAVYMGPGMTVKRDNAMLTNSLTFQVDFRMSGIKR